MFDEPVLCAYFTTVRPCSPRSGVPYLTLLPVFPTPGLALCPGPWSWLPVSSSLAQRCLWPWPTSEAPQCQTGCVAHLSVVLWFPVPGGWAQRAWAWASVWSCAGPVCPGHQEASPRLGLSCGCSWVTAPWGASGWPGLARPRSFSPPISVVCSRAFLGFVARRCCLVHFRVL